MSINIAVTGQVFSGKTTVSKFMKVYNFKFYNADEIAYKVLKLKKVKEKIYNFFGDVFRDGEIDRKKLAEKVFENKENWERINQIVHPEVIERIKRIMEKSDVDNIFEIPLLYEAKMEKMFDFVVYVKADYSLRRKIAEERGFDEEDLRKRQQFLISDELKERKSDFIIINSSNLNDLRRKVEKVIKQIKKRSEKYAKGK